MRIKMFRWEDYRPTLEEYMYICGFIQCLKHLDAYDAFVKLLWVNGRIEYGHDDSLTRRAVSNYCYKRLAFYRNSRSVDLLYDVVVYNCPPQGRGYWVKINRLIPAFEKRSFK